MKINASALTSAFQRFVELVQPIEDVYYVVAFEPRRPDIFTYIRQRDEDVMKQVFRAEDAINDEFPDILIEFHTVYLEGRPIQDFVRPFPELMYTRPGLKPKVLKRGDAG